MRKLNIQHICVIYVFFIEKAREFVIKIQIRMILKK